MGDRHRLHEVLLEARLDRGLDLLDRTDHSFDLGARGAVQERDPRARAGGVPGGRHAGRIAVGYQAENERVHGVDATAEGPCEPDPVDALQAVAIHQQPTARVQAPLASWI